MSEKTTKTAEVAAVDPEELVEYTAPIDPKGELQDIIVGVNGKLLRIKRGVTVKIPRKFKEVLDNADAQNIAALKAQEKIMREAEKPIYEM